MDKNELKGRIAVIDNALKEYLCPNDNLQKVIYKAMNYSVFAGGKRLRPILLLEWCRICGGDTAVAMPFACAMELIHTYSLIHDDLPAMDNDTLRRGKPTSHIEFGEAMAILAGDALLNCAFEIMSRYGKNVENALDIIYIISSSSGSEGMIGGQVVDIESEGRTIEIEDLRYLHSLKTGAIIKSSCVAGAMAAGADEEKIKAAESFAENLGIAFQIRDDILDVEGSVEALGKPIGSDDECGKNTYVSLLGIEKSKELVREYSEKARRALDIFGAEAVFLRDLIDYLINRTN